MLIILGKKYYLVSDYSLFSRFEMKSNFLISVIAIIAFSVYVLYVQRRKFRNFLVHTPLEREEIDQEANGRGLSLSNTLDLSKRGDFGLTNYSEISLIQEIDTQELSKSNIDVQLHNVTCNSDSFFVPEKNLPNCYVRKPENYTLFFNRSERLWNIPHGNIGKLNHSNKWFKLQAEGQRWLSAEEEVLHFEENGGTSMRHWGDNFAYLKLLIQYTNIFSRCSNQTKPIILDTGAGTASLSAAARDVRGGNGSVNVLSYVPIDDYYRLGAMISERALPVFLHHFDGNKIPVPNASFDVVHCRWCWHHTVGYDIWLREVDRILNPGGVFVFTFVPMKDVALLPHKPWFEALAKMPWDCSRYHKIMQVCVKRKDETDSIDCKIDYNRIPDRFEYQITQAFNMIHSNSEHIDNIDRVLNMNCPSASTCTVIESLLDKQTIMHTCRNDGTGNKYLQKLIRSGYVGILHNWKSPAPFYPRSFDVIHFSCKQKDKLNHDLIYEMHRLLRPQGFLISLNSTCPSLNEWIDEVRKHRFRVLENRRGIFVAQRGNT